MLESNCRARCSICQTGFVSVGAEPLITISITRPVRFCGTSCGKQRNRRSCGELNFAAIGLDIAAQDSQERRFARAIATQQANALAGLDLTRNIVQQQRTAKSDAKFIDGDQGHSEIESILNRARRHI